VGFVAFPDPAEGFAAADGFLPLLLLLLATPVVVVFG